jgi:uncharacterized membrane protein YeaQ/YmgE (transglycosylase-associated protein family)
MSAQVASRRAGLTPQAACGKESTMNFILWLVVGGVVGWLASLVMKTDAHQGIFLNVLVGIVGAFVAGLLISPLLGVGTINQGISVASVGVSLLGAIVLLALINLVRRGSVR